MRTTPAKVIGIGLNKTGTKTLAAYLRQLGFRHRSYDSNDARTSPSFDLYAAGRTDALLALLDDYDSAEDWPWPLLYRELDARYPDARFVLTVRSDPERWYRSLCNMAVRIGPLPLYERTVYGHAMPQGHREALIGQYLRHEAGVLHHFRGREHKLLRVCWDHGDDELVRLLDFLGRPRAGLRSRRVNASPALVYEGDSIALAHLNRIAYQRLYGPRALPRRVGNRLRRTLQSSRSQSHSTHS